MCPTSPQFQELVAQGRKKHSGEWTGGRVVYSQGKLSSPKYQGEWRGHCSYCHARNTRWWFGLKAKDSCCLLTLVSSKKKSPYREWWLIPVTLVLRRLEKDSYQFKAGLSFRMKPSVKTTNEVPF